MSGAGAHFLLGHRAEWKQCARELGLTQREQKVRLILARIHRPQQMERAGVVALDARIMPGGDVAGAQGVGALPQPIELDVAVAEHTWIGRPAFQVLVHERPDYALSKFSA